MSLRLAISRGSVGGVLEALTKGKHLVIGLQQPNELSS